MCETCSLDQFIRVAVAAFRCSVRGLGTGLMLADTASAKETKPPPKPQNVLSPDAALNG